MVKLLEKAETKFLSEEVKRRRWKMIGMSYDKTETVIPT